MVGSDREIFNFVDVETTGTKSAEDRIIEVAAIKTQGDKILDIYTALVNPGFRPSSFILGLTGIKYEDLEVSKRFQDIAGELYEFLSQGTFVAHNARFDYSFLKNEFLRAGFSFLPKILCTVRLSSALYPHLKKHNLESLVKRLHIKLENHHRAYDDAYSLFEFIKLERCNRQDHDFHRIISELTGSPAIPKLISKADLDSIPDTTGVYLFLNAQAYPIYIGMSKSIRQRVLSHFYQNLSRSKEMKISTSLNKIHYIETAGILGAQLRESQLIKQYQPLYNRKLRRNDYLTCVIAEENENEYINLSIGRRKNINQQNLHYIVGIYNSVKQAKANLAEIAKEHKLCPQYLGLEPRSRNSCFNYYLKLCSGACRHDIPVEEYNRSVYKAFNKTRLCAWPYGGEIEVVEETNKFKETFVIDKWVVKSARFEGDYIRSQPTLEAGRFDLDTYKILHSFLNREFTT